MPVILRAAVSILAAVGWASACSCVSWSGCPELGGAKRSVFVGTVLEITNVLGTFPGRKARVRVNEPFGGLPPGVQEIDVHTGAGGGDCGFPFEPGRVYLIDADRVVEGRVSTSICTNTREIEGAGAVVRVLRQRRDGQRIP